jgi:hypothetical protein
MHIRARAVQIGGLVDLFVLILVDTSCIRYYEKHGVTSGAVRGKMVIESIQTRGPYTEISFSTAPSRGRVGSSASLSPPFFPCMQLRHCQRIRRAGRSMRR